MADGPTPHDETSASPGPDGSKVGPAGGTQNTGTTRARLPRPMILGVATFLVGLLIGGLVVGFAGWGSGSSGGGQAAAGGSASDSPSPTPSASPSGAAVTVNSACLRAVNDAQAVAKELAGLRSAVTGLDASQLDKIVQRENILQLRLRQEIKGCHATVRLPDGSLSPTPVVSTSP